MLFGMIDVFPLLIAAIILEIPVKQNYSISDDQERMESRLVLPLLGHSTDLPGLVIECLSGMTGDQGSMADVSMFIWPTRMMIRVRMKINSLNPHRTLPLWNCMNDIF